MFGLAGTGGEGDPLWFQWDILSKNDYIWLFGGMSKFSKSYLMSKTKSSSVVEGIRIQYIYLSSTNIGFL